LLSLRGFIGMDKPDSEDKPRTTGRTETGTGNLTLRRTNLPNASADDFEVIDAGRAVGRIYLTSGGMRGSGYQWTIYGSARHGFAGTLEEAKAQWRAAYEAR
jgi:hypothetical protein